MTRPSWLGRATRNRHRHAIEQASHRWRGGRRDDSARTRRKILISTQVAKRSAVPLCQFVHTGDMHRMLHDAHLRADGRGIDYSGVASELDVMKIIDRRLYDPITSQLKRALESGRGTAAALAEARRTKLTKHHPELSGLVEDVRRIH
jgi:hypothetical protein